MATDLKKFSEEKYSTKDDVSKSLNIFNIEVFWQQILDYRKQFAKSLVISNIDRSHFSLTLTNSITNRLINLERKTNSAYLKYVKMGELAKNRLKSSIYEDILSLYSRINNVDISSSFIQYIYSCRKKDRNFLSFFLFSKSVFLHDCYCKDSQTKCCNTDHMAASRQSRIQNAGNII